MSSEEDSWDYTVLVNAAGQHSLWPEFKPPPPGWTAVGPVGDRAGCLTWVEQHWKDIRPQATH